MTPDLPEPEQLQDRTSQMVAVFIVLGTLAAAVVGFLFTSASRSGDAAAVQAQRRAVSAGAAEQSSRLWTDVQYQLFVQGTEESRRAAEAHVENLLGGGNSRTLSFEEQRWKAVSTRTQQLVSQLGKQMTGQSLSGRLGPDQDPSFPTRFFTESRRSSITEQGLEDAANEVNSAWSSRTAVYTAILTLFAVALYLLGFSLTLQSGVKQAFAVIGVMFVAVGLLWAGMVAVGHPRTAPDAAAQWYSKGEVALLTASDAYDNSGYRTAVADFDRAIALRPTYARAYEERADAVYIAASPQRSSYISLTTPEALRRSIDDLQQALRLGLTNARTLGNLGYDLFQLALQSHEPNLFDQSLSYTSQAIAAAPTLAYLRFNLGVTLLADGRFDEAMTAYRDALRHSQVGDEDLLAGALTDLELVARYEPTLAARVQTTKGYIVGSVSSGKPGVGTSAATISGTKAVLFPAAVQVEDMTILGIQANDDISLQWYYNDPGRHGWFVLPDVSGTAYTSDKQGEEYLTRGSNGTYFNQRSHLRDTSPPECLAPGQYRVEIYVNGQLKSSPPPATTTISGLQPAVLRDLDVAMCHPSDWIANDPVPGVIEGFRTADGSRGAYVFRLTLPQDLTSQQLQRFPEVVINAGLSSFSDLFPGRPVSYAAAQPQYYLGLAGGTAHYFSYPDGYVLADAGYDQREGIVILGVTFGPYADFDTGGLGLRVADSMTRYQPLPA